jgi:hypothetical protein
VSLILDALNRSRQDESPVPNLATHHQVEKVEVESRQYLPWIALSVALVIIAWLALDRFLPAPDVHTATPVAEQFVNIDNAAESVATQPKSRAEAVEEAPLPAVVNQVSEPLPANNRELDPEPAPEPVAVSEEIEPRLPPAENSAVAQLYQNPKAANDAAVRKSKPQPIAADESVVIIDEQAVNIEEVLQQARDEMKNEHLNEHAVPLLSSMSQQTKDGVPTVYYQRHDYSSDANISTVVLNGKPLKVGGSPLSGMKVEEILPDSVVLSYQGTTFRLRALNSWINL